MAQRSWEQHAPNLAAALKRANTAAQSPREEKALFEIERAAALDFPAAYQSGYAEGSRGKLTWNEARDLSPWLYIEHGDVRAALNAAPRLQDGGADCECRARYGADRDGTFPARAMCPRATECARREALQDGGE